MKLEEEKPKNYLVSAFWGFVLVLIVQCWWPGVIPFSTFEFWHIRAGGPLEWLRISWPLLAWGAGVNIVISVFTKNSRWENANAEKLFGKGTLTSLWAGVMEEICFRWLIFLSSIVSAKIGNFLFFGWLGFGIPRWLQVNLFGPLANFMTLGGLKDVLVKPEAWAVGAGLLAANAFFRDGHKYQGLFGWINSWFGGMFFFWLLFKYGLLAAILVHFTYDFIIYFIRYLDMVIERKMGWSCDSRSWFGIWRRG